MLLSIIIPTFNRINLVKYTLDSLDDTHHKGINREIIVVDDGSADGTWEFIAKEYPEVILLKNKGKGAASARNTGLFAAKGKYIMYLDSDDLVGENFFAQKINMLEAHPALGACYGEYDVFASDGAFDPAKILFRHKYPLITAADDSEPHLVNYLAGTFMPLNAIIWRRDILLQCKGHDTNLAINQDVDLFIRAIFNGLKIRAVADNTKVFIRNHELDKRVGDPMNDSGKWLQILELRKNIVESLKAKGYNDAKFYRAVSNYIFGYWKKLRHLHPGIAREYLAFSRKVYWPVDIRGHLFYRLLSKILGPVRAVEMKYFLLKRD